MVRALHRIREPAKQNAPHAGLNNRQMSKINAPVFFQSRELLPLPAKPPHRVTLHTLPLAGRVRNSRPVLLLPAAADARLQNKRIRCLIVDGRIHAVRLSHLLRAQMPRPLHAEHHRRHPVRLLEVSTGKKQLRDLPVLLPPTNAERILLTDPRRVARNPADNFICCVEEVTGLAVIPVPADKPVENALKAPVILLAKLALRHLAVHTRNRQLIADDKTHHLVPRILINLRENLADDPRIFLKTLHEAPQILDQPVLENEKRLRLHHFLGLHAA